MKESDIIALNFDTCPGCSAPVLHFNKLSGGRRYGFECGHAVKVFFDKYGNIEEITIGASKGKRKEWQQDLSSMDAAGS